MAQQHRQLLRLHQPPAAALATVASMRAAHPWLRVLIVGGNDASGTRRVRNQLGGEHDLIAINAWAGFDPNAFAAALGTLRAGGLALLLSPPLTEWPRMTDPFLQRILSAGAKSPRQSRFITRMVQQLQHIGVGEFDPDSDSWLPPYVAGDANLDQPITPNREQADVIAQLLELLLQPGSSGLVLTADRGRGKSAALGLAAAAIIDTTAQPVLVTAPNRGAAATLLRSALAAGADPALLHFVAPDVLAAGEQRAALLLVDEAAALPAPLLRAVTERFRVVAFATTVHGYEGSGRGFSLRYLPTLRQLRPSLQEMSLHTPIRWSSDDPLERLGNDLLLLDCDLSPIGPSAANRHKIEWAEVDRDQLLQNPAQLRQLAALLVTAHYRTTPTDLRQMLDAPDIRVHVIRTGGQLAGVLWTQTEGGFDPALADEIYLGRRRPRGHLLAQSLACHAGIAQAATLRGWRVVRIAVHPDLQRRGLGCRLIKHLLDAAKRAGLDWVGTSFGAEAGLIAFWRKAGLVPARIGLTRDASSGTHALQMLYPLSRAGENMVTEAKARLADNFPLQRRDLLNRLEHAVLNALALYADAWHPSSPTPSDWQDAQSIVQGHRRYEYCMAAIARITLATRAIEPDCANDQRALALLRARVAGETWSSLVTQFNLGGRKAARTLFKQALALLIKATAPNPTA